MISEPFQHFLKNHGPIQNQVRVSQSYADSYRGRVPASLIDFWIEEGWGNCAESMLKVCDPSALSGVLELALRSDKDFTASQCCVFAFTAFGDLFAWHPQHRAFTISLLEYRLSAPKFFNEAKKAKEDLEIASYLVTFKRDRHDPHDNSNKPLYARAVQAMGCPGLDECFGFFPALALGGERNLKNLKRVKAEEHFAVLAQLDNLRLVDSTSYPPKVVRAIG